MNDTTAWLRDLGGIVVMNRSSKYSIHHSQGVSDFTEAIKVDRQ